MRKTDLSWQHEPTFNYVGGGSWHVWNWALMCENDHPTYRAESNLTDELIAQGLETTLTEDGRLLPTLRTRLLPVYEKVRQQAIKDGLAIEPNGHEIDAMLATFEEHYQNQRFERQHRGALNGN